MILAQGGREGPSEGEILGRDLDERNELGSPAGGPTCAKATVCLRPGGHWDWRGDARSEGQNMRVLAHQADGFRFRSFLDRFTGITQSLLHCDTSPENNEAFQGTLA